MSIVAPSAAAYANASDRINSLAVPAGALGRLGDIACWIAACQDACPPRPIKTVQAVIFAGDHGVVRDGVSAYPADVTPAMVEQFVAGHATMNVLARQQGATVKVFDLGVDADLSHLPAEVSRWKVRRGSGNIRVEDALTMAEAADAFDAGWQILAAEIAEGAPDLVILGDMGIGNTTPSAALIAATYGLTGVQVAGAGTGLDADGQARKARVIDEALARVGERAQDPMERLAALGSADLAAGVGFLVAAAEAGVPVLLDGVIACAEAAVAESLAPGAKAWFAAGHRSGEPAQLVALQHLGLTPLVDVGLRVGEGSGAMAAVGLVRSAVALANEVALLEEVTPVAAKA